MKLRIEYLSSSLLWSGKGRGALWSRPGNGLPPASRTSTLFPAAVSTCAAVPPPAPLPMMQKSKGAVRLRFPRTSSFAIESLTAEEAGGCDDRILDVGRIVRDRTRREHPVSQLVGMGRRHGAVLGLVV